MVLSAPEFLGSYVPQQDLYINEYESVNDQYNSLSQVQLMKTLPKPTLKKNGFAMGLSSKDLGSQSTSANLSMYDNWLKNETRMNKFKDILIEEPKDLLVQEQINPNFSFVTTNFNQTRDLRGDIPLSVNHLPPGASWSSYGMLSTNDEKQKRYLSAQKKLKLMK